MSAYQTILTEKIDRVGLIRLNRPKAMNALNDTLINELMQALEEYDADDDIGVMVVTGNAKAFAAGADIKEMVEASPMDMFTSTHIEAFDRIRRIQKPVIAAVSGWCLGGGNELAMSCDMIVASESAKFGQPEIALGVIPGAGGTQRLTRAVGKALAMEMILNDRRLTAEEAYRFGLVNRVVPVERYLEETLQLAQQVAARAPIALRLAKQAINLAYDAFLEDGLREERRAFYFLFATDDQKEGMRAFMDKRPPKWQGS